MDGWLVDFGLSVGANIPSTVFVIGSATQGIIGTNLIGTSTMLADYSDRVIGVSTQRTSDRTAGSLVTFNAGTATVKLRNLDGAIDPYVLEQAGLTAPGVVMRIRYRAGSTVYSVWYGYVDAWNPEAEAPTYGTVTVTATDAFALLNQKLDELLVAVGANQSASTRAHTVLDAIGWPASMRLFSTTTSFLQATTFGDTALSLIQDAFKNEIGEFYQRPDGNLFCRGRRAMATDTRSQVSQAVFGSDRLGGEIPYVGRPTTAWDKANLHNRVVAQINGSTNLQVAQDATSVGLYGTQYTIEDTSLNLTTDADALSWANYVLASDVKPTFRFSGITLNHRLEDIGVPTLAQQFGRIMGDRVTVVRRPPAQPYGSIVDSRQMFIYGISHEWDAKSKQILTTFDLTPVGKLPFFVIGSATQGVIGTNVLGW
jgi:hypothetical protein